MLFGRLELHRGHLVRSELGQDLRARPAPRGLGERPAQARRGRARRAAPRRVASGRPERLDSALDPPSPRSSGDAPSRARLTRPPGQRLGSRGVPRLALAGREVLVQRRANDRVNEPQALAADEDVSPDELIRRLRAASSLRPDTRADELQLAVVAEHGDRPRQLGRRTERGEPMQDEPAHGGRPDRLHLARGPPTATTPAASSALSSSRRNRGFPPVARMARAAELLGGISAEAVPRQGHRGGLAQRPRLQHDRFGTGCDLRPQRRRLDPA